MRVFFGFSVDMPADITYNYLQLSKVILHYWIVRNSQINSAYRRDIYGNY